MEDLMAKAMTGPISTRRHGDVLIICSNNPPVNALSTPVRQGLVDAIGEAEGDESVRAVVVACEGRTFFAGADITEFGKPPRDPWLPQVVDTIENCSKPVVAAIHGTALGGELRSRARLPLSRRGQVGEARNSGSEARTSSRRGRHPAAAVGRGSAQGARNDGDG